MDYSTMDFLYPPHFCWDKFDKNVDFSKGKFASGGYYSLYIHFPFCLSRCKFCCLFSLPCRDKKLYNEYVDLLIEEFKLYTDRIKFDCLFNVHLGGGTPTLFPVKKLLKVIKRYNPFGQINIEAISDSLDTEKIKMLKKNGIGRIMLGVQSFNQKMLKKSNRLQNNSKFFKIYSLIRKEKISVINITLIYGLPGQTLKSFLDDLKVIIRLKPESLHIYGYINTPVTIFYKEGFRRSEKESNLMHKMLIEGEKMLAKANYSRVGNDYCLNGDNRYRNQTSIRTKINKGHLALGMGAIGAFSLKNGLTVKKINTADYGKYKEAIRKGQLPIERYFLFNKEERERASLIKAYRGESLVKEGVFEKKELIKKYSSAFRYLKKKGLIKKDSNDRIIFSTKDSIIYSKIFYSPKVLNRCRKIVRDIKTSEIPDLTF